ncbi:DEAD/DEAH box helicase [Tundrisphaera lichenicola]|uniref:DEAD/DEAH box helicase n=1 Tax=Tundrisphaera lichenicola TaxID=2029860 RepID=UPI003EBEEC41
MSDPDGLELLLPAVAGWFRENFGRPTPPQRLGWPEIAAGRHTLLFAPTGSGKTLAAFLACLDHLWRVPRQSKGVRILYISPLKALNNDIYRNLQVPLDGIIAEAETRGSSLPPLTVAVRTGDTPTSDRQRMLRKPPDVLITTPESLHLLLTSKARENLGSLSHVIIDEIHALCPNKRGVFLALLLERLEAINPGGFVRVGLSATQRPLEEVAGYLGGLRRIEGEGPSRFEPRPVSIVDAGRRKDLDLRVIAPFDRSRPQPEGSIWPEIERRLLDLIREHHSTIVFANNRRVVERLTNHLNELAGADHPVEVDPDLPPVVVAKAHHGSLSQEERRETEEALKRGDLPSVIATASLELGIDMGAVDLVCQVGSPGGVARGLQRVGRAGHVVGRVSKGRMIARTTADLLESAAMARAMIANEVETLRVPTNCLDILAQQVVAAVAIDNWDVSALYDRVRCAYPYRDLSAEAFEGVLRLVSGRFPTATFRDLQARVSWDRVRNRLHPLPGTSRLAITGGGTIPDTGQYPLFLGEGGPRLGELDEEFVLERRVGETFVLGTSTWKIDAIEAHKVVVSRAVGQAAVMPFWRGEGISRTLELGKKIGALCREIAERRDDPQALVWLQEECCLEPSAASTLRDHVARQIRVAGAIPDDRTVIVETFRDPAGEVGLAVLSPMGGKLHQALKLALQGRLRQRLGVTPACLHADDGLLIRLPRTENPPLDLFLGLTSTLADELIRAELGDSALFGLRFRQNAGRALLMPRPDPSKRTPLWLQRLRAKDLLQVVRKMPDFPIVVETYRECLVDDLDLPSLRIFLDEIASGKIRVVTREGEIPSPFANDLIFKFTQSFLYQWDEPQRAPASGGDPIDPGLLDSLLEPAAIGRVEASLRGAGRPPRSIEEMAEALRRLGDLTADELNGPMAGFFEELRAQGRAFRIEIEGTADPSRWIGDEDRALYDLAFAEYQPPSSRAGRGKRSSPDPARKPDVRDSLVVSNRDLEETRNDAISRIVRRFLRTHALIGLDQLTARYPIGPALATDLLERFADEGSLIRLDPVGGSESPRWADRQNLEEVRRLSIAIRRRESVAIAPEAFADFVVRRQQVHPETRREGPLAVSLVIEQLQGFAGSAGLWETEILPRRVKDYRPAWLDETLGSGEWTWRAEADGRGDPRVAFVPRDFAGTWPTREESAESGAHSILVLDHLTRRGASFVADMARVTGLGPLAVRSELESLLRRGMVTNDRFDPLRPGGQAMAEALSAASSRSKPGRASIRRGASRRPEGRWSILSASPSDDPEGSALAWAWALIERYGILARETVELDPWAPPWRDLAPWLARSELRGELRRGYFVEGLSGVQYTIPEVVEELARSSSRSVSEGVPVLLSTLDPANLYGAGAPLDIPLLEGGTARLARNSSNFLVLITGRPVLIIEGHGRRLTGLASASELDLKSAIALLPTLAGPTRRVLKVESYNTAATLSSPAVPWLTEVGFVRDFPGMAFYAGWSSES